MNAVWGSQWISCQMCQQPLPCWTGRHRWTPTRYTNLVIKRADKGSAVVVMNRDDYTAEALRQLNNTDHYTEYDTDPTHSFAKEISDTLVNIHNCNGINKDTFNYLILVRPVSICCPKYTRQATRAVPLCRVMVAQQNVSLSSLTASYLNPLVSHIPSYIQDTTDFLRKLEGIKHQRPNSAFLVTLDVSSLYTNIPHVECMCHRSQIQQPNQTFSETPHISYPTYTDQKQFHVPRQKLSPGSRYSDGH